MNKENKEVKKEQSRINSGINVNRNKDVNYSFI